VRLIPIGFLSNIAPEGRSGHPTKIFFLSADAFGILPPISLLTPEQAMYYFMSGYTSKLRATEKGVTEPQATFSTCFGAPFLPLHPNIYVKLLGEKIRHHNSQVWLLNTGWTGGPHGIGSRIQLPYTRAMIRAVLNGHLEKIPMRMDPIFRVQVPEQVPDVPADILNPRKTWNDPSAYDQKARELAMRFQQNFALFSGQVSPSVIEAGPFL